MAAKILESQYFYLPLAEHITEATEHADYILLDFAQSGFAGEVHICAHRLYLGQRTYVHHDAPHLYYRRQNNPRAHKNENFEEFFRHCIMFPDDEQGAREIPIIPGDIEGYPTYGGYHVTPEGIFRLVVAIDLDAYHYITFISFWQRSDEESKGLLDKDWEAANAVYQYLITIINSLQIKTEVVKQDTQKIEEDAARRLGDTNPKEILPTTAKILETQYFSLPKPDNLIKEYIGSVSLGLYFEHSGFTGEIDIYTHSLSPGQTTYVNHEAPDWYYLGYQHQPRAQKNEDFEAFFRHCIMFPEDEYDARNIPVSTGDNQGYSSCFGYQLAPNGKFRYVLAIDLDAYHYITFIATYEKIDGKLKPESGGVPEHDEQAVNDVYRYLTTIVHSLQIKTDAIKKNTQMIEENAELAVRQKNLQKEISLAHYANAELQAADPFHARYYPEHFAKLQEVLAENYPDLSQTALAGIYSNARLAIAYITESYDDYREKGNTRFFGLPDLPPGVSYPEVNDELIFWEPEENEDKKLGTLCKFIAQINFSELKGIQNYLPDSGVLYFFVDSVWESQGPNFSHRVFYYDGDLSALQSAKDLDIKPEHIFDVYGDMDDEEGEPGYRMWIVPFVSILDEDEWEKEKNKKRYPPTIFDARGEDINSSLKHKSNIYSPMKRLVNIHSGDIETTNAHIGMHGGGPYMQAAEALGGKPEDYVVLLRTEHYGADSEWIYFVIAKERLKNRDFSQIYCGMSWYWNSGREAKSLSVE